LGKTSLRFYFSLFQVEWHPQKKKKKLLPCFCPKHAQFCNFSIEREKQPHTISDLFVFNWIIPPVLHHWQIQKYQTWGSHRESNKEPSWLKCDSGWKTIVPMEFIVRVFGRITGVQIGGHWRADILPDDLRVHCGWKFQTDLERESVSVRESCKKLIVLNLMMVVKRSWRHFGVKPKPQKHIAKRKREFGDTIWTLCDWKNQTHWLVSSCETEQHDLRNVFIWEDKIVYYQTWNSVSRLTAEIWKLSIVRLPVNGQVIHSDKLGLWCG
jgi:hypothetical protein